METLITKFASNDILLAILISAVVSHILTALFYEKVFGTHQTFSALYMYCDNFFLNLIIANTINEDEREDLFNDILKFSIMILAGHKLPVDPQHFIVRKFCDKYDANRLADVTNACTSFLQNVKAYANSKNIIVRLFRLKKWWRAGKEI